MASSYAVESRGPMQQSAWSGVQPLRRSAINLRCATAVAPACRFALPVESAIGGYRFAKVLASVRARSFHERV